MKPTAFSYADYVQVITDERDRARLDCAVAERNHMNTLERFLEAQERIDELQSENISLRAERDALLKSVLKPNVAERDE